ncbi:putative 3-hydroxyisobutyrate dehydrogenase, mitochondrial-like [Apostichopus japonicus]|uniref:3-hydroxyisobutyrate dehydrogenase n=1 Tax=Stichopus japonicus TaxID=307972 RepID=A0A2G8LPI7_STIJA|nr:putative 3-hydroxyisobutyrate dehydrogenase, mitochondrial-like [Apostichopus japonicus]
MQVSRFIKRALLCSRINQTQTALFISPFSTSSEDMQASRSAVGFIGLGNMGGYMAKNLLQNGYPIVVNDVYPEATAEIHELGGEVVETPAEVAEKVDRIVTMLPSSPNVLEVYNGPNGILGKVKKGCLLIDSSTIDPYVSQEVAALAEKHGATFMDAPVSGGVKAAKEASLTFMVGGKSEEFKAAEELLRHMGKNIVHTGPVGTGQTAKICNNMMLAISMIGVSESMNLGMRLGLDAKILAGILNTSSGRSWASEVYNPVPGVLEGVPSSNNYKGGFATALMTKDLGLAQNAATTTKSPIPMGSLAHQLYRILCNKGYAMKDFSSVYEYLKDEGSS